MRRKKVTMPPIFRRRQSQLTPKQNAIRRASLEVLSEIRQSKVAHEKSISPITVIKYTGSFRKTKGRWIAKKSDSIPRSMVIYENGKEVSIELTSSKDATTVGKFHNAVKEYLNSGNDEALSRFNNKRVKDVNGKYHKFDTNASSIKVISEAIEEPEFYEIYSP